MELQVSQLTKQYASLTAVDQLDFTLCSGQICALLGPNGAGKSSTIRMLTGLTLPDSGNIRFVLDGQQMAHLPANYLGFLPEERGLYQEPSILAILLYFAQLKGLTSAQAREQAEHWLQYFDLLERKHDALKTLSKGNQQKVQLITAVMHRPRLLILDEPFSGLDPVNQEKVMAFLKQLKSQGMAILLSAHQMSLVEQLADQFLLMNKGKLLLSGDLAQIRAASGLGDTLQVTFAETVAATSFDGLRGVASNKQISPHCVEITLNANCDIADLLQRLLDNHAFTALNTQQASLHDIYLACVAQQGEAA